jgi:hypothetical protein
VLAARARRRLLLRCRRGQQTLRTPLLPLLLWLLQTLAARPGAVLLLR